MRRVADRGERLDQQLGERRLERAEALAAEFARAPSRRRVGERRIDRHEVVRLGPVLQRRDRVGQRLRIGLRLADLLRDQVVVVGG